jgi:division protein CdvB (Snf7/Vps24/ESCRT-III family)
MSEQDKDGEKKPMKIVFAEGCFDDFEGTQEELDELISQLTTMAEDGSLLENSVAVDVEDIDEEVLELLPMLTTGNIRH